ncbi:Protein EARLY FLOWERING [Dirofilaria immitis]
MVPHNGQYFVEEKSWSELLSHARLWRNISKKRMNMILHHFLIYFDQSGEERMLALGGSGQSPQETIYTAPLIRSSLVSSVAKLTLFPYLDTKPNKNRNIETFKSSDNDEYRKNYWRDECRKKEKERDNLLSEIASLRNDCCQLRAQIELNAVKRLTLLVTKF